MATQRDRFRAFNDEDGAMSLDDLLMQIQQPQIDTEAIARQQAEAQLRAQQEAQRQAQMAAEQRAYEEQTRQAQARQEELRAQNAARLAAEQEAAMQAQAEQQARAQAEAQRQAPITTQEVINQIAAQPAPDKDTVINNLVGQIKARSNTSQWTGGYGVDDATKDMARILAETGITDISQFGKVDKYEPVQQIGMALNGQPVQGSGSQLYVMEAVDTGDGVDYVRRDLSPEQVAQVKPTYGVVTGIDEYNQPTYRTVDATNVAVKDGQLVGVTGQTFGNKLTGQVVPNTYTERQTGDFFGGTYEGKGNTGYGVQFDAQGLPIFYTQGASSKDSIVKAAIPMALLALGAYGAQSMLGAGATGGAGAGLATTGELGTLAGTAGGTGLTAGGSGFGLNAAGAGLGAGTGAGITAGTGLTGTGVLTGSSLGTGLLGTGAGVAGLTGTGVLSASELGKTLLGTTSTAPLVGTGVLTGSQLGSQLLGTGANTAATVGGVTGLTNAANVGYGALNTGVSTGITGLGSGAVNTGINPSGATTGVIEPPVTTTPATTAAKTGLTASDVIRAANVATTIAAINSATGGGDGGFPIVPIPSDWTSPIKPTSTTFTPLAPVDFGGRELLRGTQWEQLLSPDYGKPPAMPSNVTIDDLTRILGGSQVPTQNLSINDVIAGIQNQYGQTTNSAMGQKPA